jgi:hypothetical protein
VPHRQQQPAAIQNFSVIIPKAAGRNIVIGVLMPVTFKSPHYTQRFKHLTTDEKRPDC